MKTVFETEWFSVEEEYYDHIRALGGKPYYRINAPDGVMVLALTEKGEIVLVRQFRPALNQHTLEFPSGFVNHGESPEDAGVRELYEETGYVCGSVNLLGQGRIMAHRFNSHQFAVLGTGAVKAPDFECEEDIEAFPVSLAELRDLAVSGEFVQFPALALLVLADWKFGSHLLDDREA